MSCQVCHLSASLRCSKCSNTHYCSRDCQVKDWPVHKKVCSRIKRKKDLYASRAFPIPIWVHDFSDEKVRDTILHANMDWNAPYFLPGIMTELLNLEPNRTDINGALIVGQGPTKTYREYINALEFLFEDEVKQLKPVIDNPMKTYQVALYMKCFGFPKFPKVYIKYLFLRHSINEGLKEGNLSKQVPSELERSNLYSDVNDFEMTGVPFEKIHKQALKTALYEHPTVERLFSLCYQHKRGRKVSQYLVKKYKKELNNH